MLMNVLSPLDETVRDLSLAQHLPRIKKLLVYACTHQWESDAAGLSSYHLHDLVQQLLQIAPTFSDLKIHLNGVIQTLNKPAEYTLVANTIVRHLQHLYPDAISYSSDHYKSLYRIVVQKLAQDDDVNRIKKLIHFVCRDQWTHDTDAVELSELIEELHSLTPTSDELTAVLKSVVQTISKPDKYRAIAQRIIQGLAPLYHPTPHALNHPAPATSPSTEANNSLEIPLQPSEPTQIHSHDQDSPQGEKRSPGTQPKNGGAMQVPDIVPDSEHSMAHANVEPQKKPPNPISMRKKVASLSPEDLFELRNEIHKFTNPLLAKHLLFMNSYATAVKHDRDSALGEWDVMVWDALKATDLDTLLCDGLKHCRNLGEFERSLKRTARQFKNSKQYSASISAIVRAVTPTFADCQESSAIVYPPVREEGQGTPTYGKRRPLDGLPSKPLSQDPSDQPLTHQPLTHQPLAHSSAPPLPKPKVSKVSNANDDTAGLDVDELDADELETGGLETDDLEPTESDSYLENTETEWSSQTDPLPSQDNNKDNSEGNSEGNERILLEQDIHLDQQLEQQLDAEPIAPHDHENPNSKLQNRPTPNPSQEGDQSSQTPNSKLQNRPTPNPSQEGDQSSQTPNSLHDRGGSEEETAYFVMPPPSAETSKQNQWSPESRSKPSLEHYENSHQAEEPIVNETLFLHAP